MAGECRGIQDERGVVLRDAIEMRDSVVLCIRMKSASGVWRSMVEGEISREEMYKTIIKLKTGKVLGVDEIRGAMLKVLWSGSLLCIVRHWRIASCMRIGRKVLLCQFIKANGIGGRVTLLGGLIYLIRLLENVCDRFVINRVREKLNIWFMKKRMVLEKREDMWTRFSYWGFGDRKEIVCYIYGSGEDILRIYGVGG